MSAKLLLDAASKLRSAVAGLPVRHQANWQTDGSEIYTDTFDDDGHRVWVGETLTEIGGDGDKVATYIVAMQPIVALHLAEWLENAAGWWHDRTESGAVEVASAILREVQP